MKLQVLILFIFALFWLTFGFLLPAANTQAPVVIRHQRLKRFVLPRAKVSFVFDESFLNFWKQECSDAKFPKRLFFKATANLTAELYLYDFQQTDLDAIIRALTLRCEKQNYKFISKNTYKMLGNKITELVFVNNDQATRSINLFNVANHWLAAQFDVGSKQYRKVQYFLLPIIRSAKPAKIRTADELIALSNDVLIALPKGFEYCVPALDSAFAARKERLKLKAFALRLKNESLMRTATAIEQVLVKTENYKRKSARLKHYQNRTELQFVGETRKNTIAQLFFLLQDKQLVVLAFFFPRLYSYAKEINKIVNNVFFDRLTQMPAMLQPVGWLIDLTGDKKPDNAEINVLFFDKTGAIITDFLPKCTLSVRIIDNENRVLFEKHVALENYADALLAGAAAKRLRLGRDWLDKISNPKFFIEVSANFPNSKQIKSRQRLCYLIKTP